MLIRICLIVAIVAGLAVGALNFTKVREKILGLQNDLRTQTTRADTAEADLAKTRADLDTTTKQLKTTQAELEDTSKQRDDAVAEAKRRTDEATALAADLQKVTGERNTAQEELASFRATGMTPPQITAANQRINQLQRDLEGFTAENRKLGQTITKLNNELDRYRTPDKKVLLPAGLRGKVLVSDPKWNFVVLDIGENQGVLEYGEMLVNRDGKLVAKIVVRTVQKDRSVANVMPGWDIGEVLEGDQVIPANPAS